MDEVTKIMEIARQPLEFNQQSERTFDQYMNQEAKVTSDEAVEAAGDLAFMDTGANLIGRFLSARELSNSGVTPISAEEANEKYPGMETPFREPINPYIAQLQFDQQQEKAKLERKIQMGPQDGWTKTKTFGAGILAHAMDPVEFGVGSVVGWGVGGLAARGFMGSRIAAGALPGARAGSRLAFSATEAIGGNLVENLAQEATIAEVMNREGGEYAPENFITDLAINTFAASVIGVGIKEGVNLNGVKRMLRSTSPEADLAVARSVIGKVENDIRPDIEPMLKGLAQETSVKPQDFGFPEYNFERVRPDNIEGKVFYAATKERSADLSTRMALGDDYGIGVHLSDNPAVANAAATRAMSDTTGAVHEINVKDIKPLFIDDTAPDSVKQIFQKYLKQADADPKLVENASVKDIMDTLARGMDDEKFTQEGMAQLAADLRDSGYNAFVSDGRSRLGFEHEPHNHVTLLDESLISKTEPRDPTPGVIGTPNKEMVDQTIQQVSDYKQHTLVDSNLHEQVQADLEKIPAQAAGESARVKAEIQDTLDDLKAMKDQELLTADEVKALESISKDVADLEVKNTIFKAAAVCVGL